MEKEVVVLDCKQEALLRMVEEMYKNFTMEATRKENQFKGAIRRIQEKDFSCCQCEEKEIGFERFYANPLTSTCGDACEEQLEKTRQYLVKKRDEHLTQLEKVTREFLGNLQSKDAVMTSHPADQNSHTSTTAIRQRQLEHFVDKFDQAIALLDQGKYGICEECHEKISTKRLELVPCTQHCIDCKKELEEKNKVPNGFGGKTSLSRLDKAIQL